MVVCRLGNLRVVSSTRSGVQERGEVRGVALGVRVQVALGLLLVHRRKGGHDFVGVEPCICKSIIGAGRGLSRVSFGMRGV